MRVSTTKAIWSANQRVYRKLAAIWKPRLSRKKKTPRVQRDALTLRGSARTFDDLNGAFFVFAEITEMEENGHAFTMHLDDGDLKAVIYLLGALNHEEKDFLDSVVHVDWTVDVRGDENLANARISILWKTLVLFTKVCGIENIASLVRTPEHARYFSQLIHNCPDLNHVQFDAQNTGIVPTDGMYCDMLHALATRPCLDTLFLENMGSYAPGTRNFTDLCTMFEKMKLLGHTHALNVVHLTNMKLGDCGVAEILGYLAHMPNLRGVSFDDSELTDDCVDAIVKFAESTASKKNGVWIHDNLGITQCGIESMIVRLTTLAKKSPDKWFSVTCDNASIPGAYRNKCKFEGMRANFYWKNGEMRPGRLNLTDPSESDTDGSDSE